MTIIFKNWLVQIVQWSCQIMWRKKRKRKKERKKHKPATNLTHASSAWIRQNQQLESLGTHLPFGHMIWSWKGIANQITKSCNFLCVSLYPPVSQTLGSFQQQFNILFINSCVANHQKLLFSSSPLYWSDRDIKLWRKILKMKVCHLCGTCVFLKQIPVTIEPKLPFIPYGFTIAFLWCSY